MHKSLITAAMAIATLSSSLADAQPQQGPQGRAGGQFQQGQFQQGQHQRGYGPQGLQSNGCYQGERPNDCSQRLRAQQRTHHNYVWQNGRYIDQDAHSAAAAAGIIGFIMGLAVAGSSSDRDYYEAHRNDRNWRNRCRSTYQSFDYNTGTYIGRDGYRHYCTR
jgi:hypothetical protein